MSIALSRQAVPECPHSLASSVAGHSLGLGLQTALACFEAKKKLLQQARILKDAFIITAQEPLPDDLVTAVQVKSL